MPHPEPPKTPSSHAHPALRGLPPATPEAAGAVVAAPSDLVARALAILAEEVAAWNARRSEDLPSRSPR